MRTGADVAVLVWRLVPGCTPTAAGDQEPAAVGLAMTTWSPALGRRRSVITSAFYRYQRRRLGPGGRGRKWREPGSDDVTCDVVNAHRHECHARALHQPHVCTCSAAIFTCFASVRYTNWLINRSQSLYLKWVTASIRISPVYVSKFTNLL